MKEVVFEVSLEGTKISETLEVDEFLTDDEIEDMYIDWRGEHLHGGWSVNGDWVEVE